MTAAPMTAIEPYRIGDQKMAHKLAQICIGNLNQQMKMIDHQNVGNQFDTESLTAVKQRFDKFAAIRISDKNIIATIAPIHYMVISARVLDS